MVWGLWDGKTAVMHLTDRLERVDTCFFSVVDVLLRNPT